MQITVLESKIHRATVTNADLNYQGSITLDAELCRAARIHPWDRVDTRLPSVVEQRCHPERSDLGGGW